MPPIVGVPAPSPRSRAFRTDDAATLLLGLLVAAVGAFAWLGPARVPAGHRLELADPRLGAEPFELTIALDPRSGAVTLDGLSTPGAREGETFPVPYGPDAGRRVQISGVERSEGLVRIRTRCPTCRTVEWGRRDAVLDIRSTQGTVVSGMGYALHVRAGAGPLQVEVRTPGSPSWRHALGPLEAVALQDADCPSEEGPCSFAPGFALTDGSAIVRLRAREGSAGFEIRLVGIGHRTVAMRDRRSAAADGLFAAWLALGLLVAGASLLRAPSARLRAALLLAAGLSVPLALWLPGSSDWYWLPVRPVPMAPLLAGSSVVVSSSAAYLVSRDAGLPWAWPRRVARIGTVALVLAFALAVPALLIDDRTDPLVGVPPIDGGAQVGYVSLYVATALGLLGGWLLGTAGRDRATMTPDERRPMP